MTCNMDNVYHEIPLRKRTTMRLGGTAMAEIAIHVDSDLEKLPAQLAELGGEALVMGAGSNIIAQDGHLGLVLVRPMFVTGPEIVEQDDKTGTVRVGAGVKLQKFLSWLANNGLSGLEGLRGIPGSVGGAAAMNAGSWGHTFGERMTRIRIWTAEAGIRWLSPSDWSCAYRSFVPNIEGSPFIVIEAEVKMDKAEPSAIRAAMVENFMKKKNGQPVSAATAGCVFKNPEGDSAGRLLDRAGLRGVGLGDMCFSEKHANFLVNLGEGRTSEALELIEVGKRTVYDRFGVHLELEVKVVG